MKKTQYQYDVAFSFAGAQRDYVEEVKNELEKYNVSVFYDNDNSVDLWGKNLYRYLDELYSKKARYCVMFISKEYAERPWTVHESQSAQERMFTDYNNKEFQEYILPVLFDNTQIPGIRCTTGYMDANKLTPKELGKIIAQKLDKYVVEDNSFEIIPRLFKELSHLIVEQLKNLSSYSYEKGKEFIRVVSEDTNHTILLMRLSKDVIVFEFGAATSEYNPSFLLILNPENLETVKAINFSAFFFQYPEQVFTIDQVTYLFQADLLKLLEAENDIISK